MFCPYCGKEIISGARFCPACGRRLANSGDSKDLKRKPHKNGRHKQPWFLLLACLLFVIGLCIFLRYCGHDEPTEENLTISTLQLSINESLSAVEKYQDSNGLISSENAEEAILAFYNDVCDKNGVVSCYKDDYGVYIETALGLDFVYIPAIEGTDAGSGSLEIVTLQPYYTENKRLNSLFDHDGLDDFAVKLSESNNDWSFQSGNNIDDSNVTLDRILSLDDYKMILWHGHGGYTSFSGYFISTEIEVSSQLLDDYPCLNNETAIVQVGGSLGLKPAFFRDNFSDNAFDGAFIYLGTCYSGKESVMADTFVDKGAAVVFVNSDSILRNYNLNMMHFITESFCLGVSSEYVRLKIDTLNGSLNSPENWTVEDVLLMAQKYYGIKDKILFGAEVYYVGRPGVDQLTYALWLEILSSNKEPLILNEENDYYECDYMPASHYLNMTVNDVVTELGNYTDYTNYNGSCYYYFEGPYTLLTDAYPELGSDAEITFVLSRSEGYLDNLISFDMSLTDLEEALGKELSLDYCAEDISEGEPAFWSTEFVRNGYLCRLYWNSGSGAYERGTLSHAYISCAD